MFALPSHKTEGHVQSGRRNQATSFKLRLREMLENIVDFAVQKQEDTEQSGYSKLLSKICKTLLSLVVNVFFNDR